MNVPADAGAAKVRPASTPTTDAPAPANKADPAPKADQAAQAPSTEPKPASDTYKRPRSR